MDVQTPETLPVETRTIDHTLKTERHGTAHELFTIRFGAKTTAPALALVAGEV
jgi:hypothetical protein